MEHHLVLFTGLFFGIFLLVTTLLLVFSKKFTSVPFTVALLIAGFLSQNIIRFFNIDFHLTLSPDVIYFILLPILLFESAFNINIHQFKIQFKTISFLATFGLLISVFVVAGFLFYTIGLPFEIALLFGAIISATDPIAVIALFKNLGGPKRLGLVADGESMFNDATGVIVFKIVSTFVLANQAFSTGAIVPSVGNFLYVFIGSMVFGALVGAFFTNIFAQFKHDRVGLTTISIAVAILVFGGSEHFFGLSGVITTVVTALILGNFAKPKITSHTLHFMEEFWENLGVYCIGLVFFFSTFNLDISIFSDVSAFSIGMAVLSVLIARAVSIYFSCWITNNTPFFHDEPNVPLRWQHILNWGGLRGVIPLVLVYSLPEDFAYYNEMLAFTLGSFLFTLLINGFTIKFLLTGLGLHLPEKEEEIIKEETDIFTLEELKNLLKKLPQDEFQESVIEKVETELTNEQKEHRKRLKDLTVDDDLLLRSFTLQSLQIERTTAHELHEQGYVNERVYMEFETELDLQLDALEYPEVFAKTKTEKTGLIKSRVSFRRSLTRLNELSKWLPFLGFIIRTTEKEAIETRYMLLKTRLIASNDVLWYLNYIKQFVKDRQTVLDGISALEKKHMEFVEDNRKQIEHMVKEYPEILEEFEKKIIYALLDRQEQHNHFVI